MHRRRRPRRSWDTTYGVGSLHELPYIGARRGRLHATLGNTSFREVMGTGLSGAAAALDQPLADDGPPTGAWPHVLTTSGLAVAALRTGDGTGATTARSPPRSPTAASAAAAHRCDQEVAQ